MTKINDFVMKFVVCSEIRSHDSCRHGNGMHKLRNVDKRMECFIKVYSLSLWLDGTVLLISDICLHIAAVTFYLSEKKTK